MNFNRFSKRDLLNCAEVGPDKIDMEVKKASFINVILFALILGQLGSGCSSGSGAAASSGDAASSGGAGGAGGGGGGGAPATTECADTSQNFYYKMAGSPLSTPTTTYLKATPNFPIDTYSPVLVGSSPTYSVSPALPTGLSLNPSTGIISGTPTGAPAAAAVYTVTVSATSGGVVSSQACRFTYQSVAAGAAGVFTAVGAMVVTRSSPVSILLPNNKVLVMGGSNSGSYLQTAELYDPGTGLFVATGTMSRYGATTATILQDGRVLVAGGYTNPAGTIDNLTLEIYDPNTGLFTSPGASLVSKPYSAALLSNNGKVLFAEGATDYDPNDGTNTIYMAQTYDPSGNTVANSTFNGGTLLSVLNDGKILIRGFKARLTNAVFGNYYTVYRADAKIYDPVGNTTNNVGQSYKYNDGSSPPPRQGLLLADHTFLFADFDSHTGYTVFQVYDPVGQTFTSTAIGDSTDDGIPLKELSAGGNILLGAARYGFFNTYDPSGQTVTSPHAITVYQHGTGVVETVLASGDVLTLGKASGPSNAEVYKP